MKPDWKDAPDWARYLAMDFDGEWCWYEEEPVRKTYSWLDNGGRCTSAGCSSEYWQESLEQRPETSGTTSGGTT